MKKCYNCGCIFEQPSIYSEDLTPGGVSEGGSFVYKYDGCPNCGEQFGEIDECVKCGEMNYIENGTYNENGFICENCLEEEECDDGTSR